MKRLVVLIAFTLVLVVLAGIGCTNRELGLLSPQAGQEVASTCVTCHTDKETLQKVASAKVEDTKSEATSGEG